MSKQLDSPTPEENDPPIEELFLLHLRFKEAQVVRAEGNHPILLDTPEVCWVVYSGYVNIFAVEQKDDKLTGKRAYLFRVNPGQVLFGIAPTPDREQLKFLAVGGGETQLLRLPLHRLRKMGQDIEFQQQIVRLIDNWVHGLSASLVKALPPKECLRITPDQEYELPPNGSICASKGVLWLNHLSGQSQFIGKENLPLLNSNTYWPVTHQTWLQAAGTITLHSVATSDFMAEEAVWMALPHFHTLALVSVGADMKQMSQAENQELVEQSTVNKLAVSDALSQLAATLQTSTATLPLERQEPLLQACRLIGKRIRVDIQAPPKDDVQVMKQHPIEDIARASRIQVRKILLKDRWWRRDNGPLLAYMVETQHPVALLPPKPGSYEVHDPTTGKVTPLTAKVAQEIESFAYMFYRPFPSHAITAFDLIKFGLRGYDRRDLRAIALAGSAVALLGLLVPLATGIIFDVIIPTSNRTQLMQLTLVLIVVAVVGTAFQIFQNIATLRLEGKLGPAFQAAAWDRLLKLPVSFFRDYTAGDLAARAMGISTIQQILSGTAVQALLAGIFSIYTFILLISIDKILAQIALGLVIIAAVATVLAGYAKIQHVRRFFDLHGQMSGLVLQVVSGVAKFRAAGAEARAFSFWAKAFSQLKQTNYKVRSVDNNLVAFNAAYNIIAILLIFGAFAFSSREETLSTGTFLAFFAAFSQLLGAILTLSNAVLTSLNVLPIYERTLPILQTLPELEKINKHPGPLTGELEVNHVSFRYRENAPLVLKDVSLQVNPGEFVALVGSSGSGKTTLFRMLLGFEKPVSGSIYYNGLDLSGVDLQAVRQQIGVVLQTSQLVPGTILSNIIGSSLTTREAALDALRAVGMYEEVEKMPMGELTVLSAGGNTLSGGQRQRILIARAIVNKPRILFFDEATSALDNKTQAIVSKSLESLQATRIVIAHRLSTVINADKIYVMQNGAVVQSGTYEELSKQPGVFAELAKRQLA